MPKDVPECPNPDFPRPSNPRSNALAFEFEFEGTPNFRNDHSSTNPGPNKCCASISVLSLSNFLLFVTLASNSPSAAPSLFTARFSPTRSSFSGFRHRYSFLSIRTSSSRDEDVAPDPAANSFAHARMVATILDFEGADEGLEMAVLGESLVGEEDDDDDDDDDDDGDGEEGSLVSR